MIHLKREFCIHSNKDTKHSFIILWKFVKKDLNLISKVFKKGVKFTRDKTHNNPEDVTRSPKQGYQPRRCHQKSKTGVSLAPQKGLMSSKIEKKTLITTRLRIVQKVEGVAYDIVKRFA